MEGDSAPADKPPAACEAAAEAFPRAPAPLRIGPSRSPLRNGAQAPRYSPAAGQARGRRSPVAARQAPADEACEAAAEAFPCAPAPCGRGPPARLCGMACERLDSPRRLGRRGVDAPRQWLDRRQRTRLARRRWRPSRTALPLCRLGRPARPCGPGRPARPRSPECLDAPQRQVRRGGGAL